MKYVLILATALFVTSCSVTQESTETQTYILKSARYRYTVEVTYNDKKLERFTYEGYDGEFPYLQIYYGESVAIGDTLLAKNVQSLRLIEQTLISK
jgi:hypothetical protein